MPFELTLHASDPVLRDQVEGWLRGARLSVERPLVLHVAIGDVAGDAVGDAASLAAGEAAFRQGNVAIRGGGSEPLVLDWEPGLGRAVLEPRSDAAHVVVTREGIQRTNVLFRSFLLNVCIMLLRRAGLHHVHGAALQDPQGRGWLLVGVSQSGKSTTTAVLGQQGWAVGTDDIAFFTRSPAADGTDVVAWREPLALRPDAAAAIGPAGGTDFGPRRKRGWFPEELGTTWVSRITPEVLVFPRVDAEAPSVATPITSREALTRMMRCSPWVALEPELADEHLGLMARLAAQSRAYTLSLGSDLLARPSLLQELIA